VVDATAFSATWIARDTRAGSPTIRAVVHDGICLVCCAPESLAGQMTRSAVSTVDVKVAAEFQVSRRRALVQWPPQ
jgi:hypothetical protein